MRLNQFLFTGFTLTFLGLAAGCSNPEPEAGPQQAYFDVPGFVQEQVKLLETSNAGLQKTVGFGPENPETQTIAHPDWNKELALFKEIDLNKKALAGNYSETKAQLPEGSKLLYTRNEDSNAPIIRLEVTLNPEQKVTSLHAIYEQENALFFNRETRTLQTENGRQVKAYEIKGVQKVLLFDSSLYRIKTTLP